MRWSITAPMLLALTFGCATPSAAPPVEAPSAPPHVPTEEEQAAFLAAKPVFTARCMACHSRTGARHGPRALHHLDMTSYPFAGHHAGEAGAAVREALTGKKPSMPKGKPGSLTAEELALILAWADAFDRGAAASSTEHGGHGEHEHHEEHDEHEEHEEHGEPLDAGPGGGG